MKKNYDKKHMERSYEPGELVAVWTPIRKIGKCEKLLRKYFGPYRILKKLSNVNYLIEPKDNPGQDTLIVHVSRIKPYFERIDELLRVTIVYGDHALAERTCQKCFAWFKSGNFDLEDEERSGAPSKFENEELEARLDEDPTQMRKGTRKNTWCHSTSHFSWE
ncbi:hypothetical protein LAZ67_22000993 [Cordylochernes scorpioides]|uniref:Integrase p58-like C-terminal domain-containing protein n=1 Tax=Cordylochernes scorpioides TaxID=51811 RepID=A0ABY6LNR5_9ARAC|nr:hypothetical protein LAZ67_22000993 [Cordylochernes scorpioides]